MTRHLTKSFGRWLLQQTWRDGPVGAFARGAARSRQRRRLYDPLWIKIHVRGEAVVWPVGHMSLVDFDAYLCRQLGGRVSPGQHNEGLRRAQYGLSEAWTAWEYAMTAPAAPRKCEMCGEKTCERGIFYPAGPHLRGRRVLPFCRHHLRKPGMYAAIEYRLSH